MRDVHARYAELFCGGNTTEAELELREAARAENEGAQTLYGGQGAIATLRFGYRAGVAATLAVWVMWDCVEVVNSVHKHMDKDSVAAKAAWPLFRVSGVLLAWHWLWGLSLWVWHGAAERGLGEATPVRASILRLRVRATPFFADVATSASFSSQAPVSREPGVSLRRRRHGAVPGAVGGGRV